MNWIFVPRHSLRLLVSCLSQRYQEPPPTRSGRGFSWAGYFVSWSGVYLPQFVSGAEQPHHHLDATPLAGDVDVEVRMVVQVVAGGCVVHHP